MNSRKKNTEKQDKAEASAEDIQLESFEEETDQQQPAEGAAAQQEEQAEPEFIEVSRSEYEQLKKERDEARDRMLRIAADFENYRKRAAKDRALTEISASKNAMRNLLLILSSVNRGIESDPDADTSGLEVIRDQINSILEAEGVSVIRPKGEKFDPERHEALFMEETDEVPDKTVLEEIEIGYSYRGTVLQPAKVKVSKLPEPDLEETEKTDEQDLENQESEESDEN